MPGLRSYLEDPLLDRMYRDIREAGAIRSISLDITDKCNLRCKGCYYFEEGMDRFVSPGNEELFDEFIGQEKARGTNFVTIVGGEPTLVLDRVKKIHDNFRTNVATNGLIKIPFEGFEKMPIGIAVWGDYETDKQLRSNSKKDLFSIALENYRDDPRAFWYYTVAPGCAEEVERVVERCVENGNYVLFNYYSDVGNYGGLLDYRLGFKAVQSEIDRMIEQYPGRIFMTSYFNQVISSGKLFDESWGYDVCTNLSTNYDPNAARLKNGKPYNKHFRAYYADFKTTRRCCTGVNRDCDSCFDTWEHFSWIMINMKKHLGSKAEFANWLSNMYLFYLINRIIDFDEGVKLLPQIQAFKVEV